MSKSRPGSSAGSRGGNSVPSDPAAGEAPGRLAFAYDIVPGPAAPAKLAFTVRVFDRKGRASDFAAPAAVDLARKDARLDPPAPKGVS